MRAETDASRAEARKSAIAKPRSCVRDNKDQRDGEVSIDVWSERKVCVALGIHRATIRRMETRGDFPARRQLSPGRVGWPASEIARWLASRPTNRVS